MHVINTFYVNSLRECLYVLSSESKECVIVDPGCQNDRERARVEEYLETEGLRPVCILLTHAHFDHVLSLGWFAGKYGIPAVMSAADSDLLSKLRQYTNLFGMEYIPTDRVTFRYVSDGEEISYAGFTFKVIATPGHTEGGICYLEQAEKILFTGDTLFEGSIGRTDFEESGEEDMCISLEKLKRLDKDIAVYPGHGYSTTIGEELRSNPYLR
ncbi:MAG: MBL fold metallo-hydrolase [Bacteroidales bacterium]|nr:MBL fold metallo-hydrolase [Bacteroidales bacterium]